MIRKALASATALLALPFLTLGAQTRGGLTKVELLGLQQQMRDEGCGNQHAAGVWDEPTRRAIRNCAKKYNTAADARALLQAMNIGFNPGEGLPAGSAAPMSGDMSGMNMSGDAMKMKTSRTQAGMRQGTARAGAQMKMKGDSAMMKMHERMMKTHDTTMMKMMRDSMMKSGDTAMMKMHESMMMKMHDSTMMKMSDTAMMKMHDSMMMKMKMKHDSTTKRDSTTIH